MKFLGTIVLVILTQQVSSSVSSWTFGTDQVGQYRPGLWSMYVLLLGHLIKKSPKHETEDLNLV